MDYYWNETFENLVKPVKCTHYHIKYGSRVENVSNQNLYLNLFPDEYSQFCFYFNQVIMNVVTRLDFVYSRIRVSYLNSGRATKDFIM